MKILLVNDDGINALGLKEMAKILKEFGEVLVVAPKVEQSAKSHSLTLRPFSYEKKDLLDGIEAYSVDSTPADCVRFAIYYLGWNGDIVVSGVNNGYNLGEDITYSGTVAGAVEGALRGHKSIAFSCEYSKILESVNTLRETFKYILDSKLLDRYNTLNVNCPTVSKGIKYTTQGEVYFDTVFEEDEKGVVNQVGSAHHEKDNNEKSDVYAIHNSYTSISFLSTNRTIKID